MQYQEKTLSSGRVVSIRPLSWQEYWEMGEQRLALTKPLSVTEKTAEQKLAEMRELRALREQPLRWCVQDFDTIAAECSLADIVELEQLINALSEAPVREGNSAPAAAPTATVTA